MSFPEVHKDSVDIEKLLMDAVEHRSALLLSVKTYCKESIYFCVCFQYMLCSASGWDAVVDGLVWLGFNLMETYAPKSSSESFVRAICKKRA